MEIIKQIKVELISEMFKIDLIVWKFFLLVWAKKYGAKFKIDLIVWKLEIALENSGIFVCLK